MTRCLEALCPCAETKAVSITASVLHNCLSFAKKLDAAGRISRVPMFAVQRVPQCCGVNGIPLLTRHVPNGWLVLSVHTEQARDGSLCT